MMSKFFFKWNIFFTFKVMGVFVISISYYLVITLIETQKKSSVLSFDSTTNDIEGVYKSSFDIFLVLKKQLQDFEDFESQRDTYLNNTKFTQYPVTINNISYTKEVLTTTHYNMTIPSNDAIQAPKLNNLLMPLVNNLNKAPASTITLNNLYNSDACSVLFGANTTNYTQCSTFWSSILVKGMEQSITQMSVAINTVIDELNSLKMGNKLFSEITDSTSSFSQYEMFVEYYLFLSYMKTVDIFLDLKERRLHSINNTFNIILYGYGVLVVALFFVLLYFVYSSKFVFNTFLNFIGILPVKYMMEDSLYKDILKLEQHIF